jgi:hypothetical protein
MRVKWIESLVTLPRIYTEPWGDDTNGAEWSWELVLSAAEDGTGDPKG